MKQESEPPGWVIFPRIRAGTGVVRSRSQGHNNFLEPKPEPFKTFPAPHPCFWPQSVILTVYSPLGHSAPSWLPVDLLVNRCFLGLSAHFWLLAQSARLGGHTGMIGNRSMDPRHCVPSTRAFRVPMSGPLELRRTRNRLTKKKLSWYEVPQ